MPQKIQLQNWSQIHETIYFGSYNKSTSIVTVPNI